jgi:hypothetical protein
VAFTIELDNEAEHRLAHWTNEDGDAAHVHAPWLVSYPLWANVLRYVGPGGTTVADLRAQARTERLLLGGFTRWGYVRLKPPAGAVAKNLPAGETVVRLPARPRRRGGLARDARRHRSALAFQLRRRRHRRPPREVGRALRRS